jgi:hypothetical protein
VSGERLRLLTGKVLRRGSLVGFATVELPVVGLVIHDCPVHETAGKRWAALPGRPQIEDGRHRLDPATGKPAYSVILSWRDSRLREAFSQRVVEAFAAAHPEAFDSHARDPP